MNIEQMSSAEIEALLAKKKQEEAEKRAAADEAYKALKNETVVKLVKLFEEQQEKLKQLKELAFNDLNTFKQLLNEKFAMKEKEHRGNFTLSSADGSYKVEHSRNYIGRFDERSNIAEQKIMSFITKRLSKDDKIVKLISSLLERRKGDLDIKLVNKLYQMKNDFDDTEWLEGLELLQESWVDDGSKDYIRVFKKGENNEWKAISLDFASL